MDIVRFFDKLEDRVRRWFSRRPILYGVIGGIGIVLFWRGVWHMADFFSTLVLNGYLGGPSLVNPSFFWDGLLSFFLGLAMLLLTGLLVSNFIGNEIIISGLRGEKKLAEKTEVEVKTEAGAIAAIQEELKAISKKVEELANKTK